MRFVHDLGDGLNLQLRDLATAAPLHDLTMANLERLRAWEAWAHGPQSLPGMELFTRQQLQGWIEGRVLPVVMVLDGEAIGASSARIDTWAGTAEIGYWVDRSQEGRGVARRCVGALVDDVLARSDVHRVEIRTSAHNERSRALAERLGFSHEGTLNAAKLVGGQPHDVAVYGLVSSS